MTRIYFAISFGIKGCRHVRLSSLSGWICSDFGQHFGKATLPRTVVKLAFSGLVVDQQGCHVAGGLDFNVKGFFKLDRLRLLKGSIRFHFSGSKACDSRVSVLRLWLF
jgi:hypothetical protein